jgi:MoxR-like ATPase
MTAMPIIAPPPSPFTRSQFDWAAAMRAVDGLLTLQAELNDIFQERSEHIEQMVRALLMKEHVLQHGIFGTGKSDLVDTCVECIKLANPDSYFSYDLTRATTESDIYGVPNIKIMRDEGRLLRDKDGTIRVAVIARLDEFLDATVQLQRSMLGTLNEREYRRGQERHHMPLHTAFATTNVEPDTLLKRESDFGAIMDRFIFHGVVHWLTQTESRLRMYEKFLRARRPNAQLLFTDLDQAAKIICAPTDQVDLAMIPTYEEVVETIHEAWRKKNWRQISDRTKCKWWQMLEANALLNRRWEVNLTDLYSLQWSACVAGKPEQREEFERVASPVIAKAIEAQAQSVDEVQIQMLEKLAGEVPPIPAAPSNGELVDLRRALLSKLQEVKEVRPQEPPTEAKKRKLVQEIEEQLLTVQQKIDGR